MKTQTTPSPSVAAHSPLPWTTEQTSDSRLRIISRAKGCGSGIRIATFYPPLVGTVEGNVQITLESLNSHEALEARNAELEVALKGCLEELELLAEMYPKMCAKRTLATEAARALAL